jgi:steroid delta-isomerase-like uncharacterized protein
MEEISKNLVQRMNEKAWNLGKLEVIDNLCAANYVGIEPYGNEYGPEAVKQGVKARRAAFPDIHVEIDEMIAADDKVVARLTFTGTHEGEFQGIKPTHREVTWSGICIYRIAHGKFTERWHRYDMLGMLQQLGAVPGH